ncbi:hypothetical protein OPV22_007440 [Ensete ventricosum]|uniref:Uncharacterized protein n=1 Tax=Ensete ventricosum TaxID=4639 RepID=A0AAV8RU57_ENSVE|nr:hypothetical protein OPV22_007440 [Ensete ventricosum]
MWELAAVLNFLHLPGFGNDLSSGSIIRVYLLGIQPGLQYSAASEDWSLMGTYQLLHPMERISRHVTLGPSPHMLIFKALCSIRVEV